jgi:xanthine dehydrogenase molybdopterin-binding subunit B
MIVVHKVWIAHDVGPCINPTLVIGQVEGSVYMGLGEALMESHSFRRLPKDRSNALVHRHPSILDYKTPTFLEMPEVTIYIVEDPDPNGPFGAKEVGQGPLLPIMPALCNGIYDAVGVRIDQIPVSPALVLKGLEQLSRSQEGRVGPTHFPAVDFGEPLRVPTLAEGGDGGAINKEELREARGTGTMTERRAPAKEG